MTHEDLRKSAVRWLTVSRRCSVVLSELTSTACETPDAIGWRSGMSCLVECKASRSDFLANAKKPSIRAGRGMGRQRYFLCITGLIYTDDLQDSDYGLLWIKNGRVSMMKEAALVETNHSAEILMLTSALRRVKTREFLTINIVTEEERKAIEEGIPA
jgi:hypothetical protein